LRLASTAVRRSTLVDIDLGDDGLLKRPRFIAGNSFDWPKRIADQVLAAFENKLSIFELRRLNYVVGALYAEAALSSDAKCNPRRH
jgi:anhydro-N-acetylmuramic acid kinase